MSGKLTSSAVTRVFNELLRRAENGERVDDIKALVEEMNLLQLNEESDVQPFIDQVIEQNPEKVAQYKEGKTGLIGFFMGQVMRLSNDRANPEVAKKLLHMAITESNPKKS